MSLPRRSLPSCKYNVPRIRQPRPPNWYSPEPAMADSVPASLELCALRFWILADKVWSSNGKGAEPVTRSKIISHVAFREASVFLKSDEVASKKQLSGTPLARAFQRSLVSPTAFS